MSEYDKLVEALERVVELAKYCIEWERHEVGPNYVGDLASDPLALAISEAEAVLPLARQLIEENEWLEDSLRAEQAGNTELWLKLEDLYKENERLTLLGRIAIVQRNQVIGEGRGHDE